MSIDVTFLRDIRHGGDNQQPQAVAKKFLDFINQTKRTLHIAVFDFRLNPATGGAIVNALKALAEKGVEVHIAYDHNLRSEKGVASGDPKPSGTHLYLTTNFQGTKVQLHPVAGDTLMHNKYMVRDGSSPDATIWTGSTNFTGAAWTYQENNIIVLSSPQLAQYYEKDFDQLWHTTQNEGTGVNAHGLNVPVGTSKVDVDFSPGDGPLISQTIASYAAASHKTLYIASMVLSSGTLLDALSGTLQKNPKLLKGIYDKTQMDKAEQQMSTQAKKAKFESIATHLAYKRSTPFNPKNPAGGYDFMHNKILVSDDTVVTGSFNFSENAALNGENILVIHDQGVANKYTQYIDELIKAYGGPGEIK